MRPGEHIRLKIERLSTGGDGVGRADGMVVFVPYTAPGDEAEVEIRESRKSFARGKIVQIIEPSPERATPPCAYYYRCGGCTWQHLSYEAQLAAKRGLVQESLERIGGLKGIHVKPVLGMKDPWRYRNKVQQPVGWDPAPHFPRKRDQPPSTHRSAGGHLISGFYAANSHDIVPIDDCLVQPELSVRIINRAKALLEEHRLRAYDAPHHQGWIRHILVRTAGAPHPAPSPSRGEGGGGGGPRALLAFITRTPDFPHERDVISTLIKEFPELVSIHQNVQPARSNVILGRTWRKIYGQDYLEERLGRLKFRLSPGAFFQVNTRQAEVLYSVAKNMAGKGERLLDLYAGVGTIALWLADQFKEVGGVEEFPAAVRDAEANAELNLIDNARFVAQTTESFLAGLSRDRRPLTVVLDPPRAGCSPAVLESLLALRPSPLVYVSCDSATLARDLGILSKGGYRVDEVQPVDLFPHTPHIETAVRLSKGG